MLQMTLYNELIQSLVNNNDIEFNAIIKKISNTNNTTIDIIKNNYEKHLTSFILMRHQILPKYLLNSINDIVVIYHTMGSGKSATALFTILQQLKLNLYKNFFDGYEKKSNKKHIIVIGSWQTRMQIEVEILRPEFGLISDREYEELMSLTNSPIKLNKQKAEKFKQQLISKFTQPILFVGYQAFFNVVFPDINQSKYTQNSQLLIELFKNGELHVSQQFLNTYSNCIIIVDEMQRLYTETQMNTYGIAVMCVSRELKKMKSKMLMMSGTVFNNSLLELQYLLNLCDNKSGVRTYDETVVKKIIKDDITIYTIDEIPQIIKNTFHMYTLKVDSKYKIASINKNILEQFNIHDETPAIITMSEQTPILPSVNHIGNIVIGKNEMMNMVIYDIEMESKQKEIYNGNDTDSEFVVSARDAFIPPRNEFGDYKVYIDGEGCLRGEGLRGNMLKNISIIGYHLQKIAICNSLNNEKTIVYHNKVTSFGIIQYGIILEENGCVKLNSHPKSDSICKFCKHTLKEHSLELKERVNKKVCNNFTPIYYAVLHGIMTKTERYDIVTNIFNNPNNLYGDLLSIVLVSDIAYTGISFLNTNNILILSRVSNLSKWKQIYSRIVRTHSHKSLPKNRRYAKIYTFSINDEQYYKTLLYNQIEIEKFNEKLNKSCLSQTQSIQLSQDVLLLLYDDIKQDICNIVSKSFDDVNKYCTVDYFMNLLNNEKTTTMFDYKNISNEFIISSIMNLNNISVSHLNKQFYLQYNSNTENVKIIDTSIILNINDIIDQIDNKTLIKKYLTELSKLLEPGKEQKIIQLLPKIIKFTKNTKEEKPYMTLSNEYVFWDAVWLIGDEYYDNDEENFIQNHSNRNKSTFAGMYYGTIIIMKDGSVKNLNYRFPTFVKSPKLDYLFKISTMSFTSSSIYSLHVSIIKIDGNKENNSDKRYIRKGVLCTSADTKLLEKYFPRNDKNSKREYCMQLLTEICKMQYEDNEHKFVFTPFEK